MELASPEFWLAFAQIVLIALLLGGDNAVVVAVACRNLPEQQRKRGIFWGVLGAVGMRSVLTLCAVAVLAIPFLKIAGGILLLWTAIKLVLPYSEEAGRGSAVGASLWATVKTIAVADFVMSVDNVVGVAAAARDDVTLLGFGLLVSIPIVVWCGGLVLKLMERFALMITLGGGLLGYIAGDIIARDPALVGWLSTHAAWLEQYGAAGIVGASFVAGFAIVITGMAHAHGSIEVVSKEEPSAG